MPVLLIKSPVAVFNHPFYGARLLFRQGATNPRNELGKNGITLHGPLASLFYKTITIQADLLSENGLVENQRFILNRSSLIKYLGDGAHAKDTDEVLISKLQVKLLTSKDLNLASIEDQKKQSEAGLRLRHAGEHHHQKVSYAFFRDLGAQFLSWLFQKTIVSFNRLIFRLLFVRTEKDLLQAGEVLSIARFQEASREVPAYKKHLANVKLDNLSFHEIPATSKANYIKPNQGQDAETHRHGKYPKRAKIDTSTGTTGKPTAWVRSAHEVEVVKSTLAIAEQLQFGSRHVSYINAFAFGPWATGMTTYEVMRKTGSVFASGPDKEKIYEEMLRIAQYEQNQLKLEVAEFCHQHPEVQDGKVVFNAIDEMLKALLKNPQAKLKDVFEVVMPKFPNLLQYKKEIFAMTQRLNQEKTQLLIAGYPPFLKELADYIKTKNDGHRLSDFSAVGIIGGQGNSEAMRDALMADGFNAIYSSYGASDLDINLGSEGDDEIFIRKTLEKNPGLARELYGANKGLPMVFHFDPMNTAVECDKDDELIFTTTRNDRSSPRIRYDLGDKGRVYAASDLQALLTKYGIFRKMSSNLPLMMVWGRDATVVFHGANLDFTELERAISDVDNDGKILKKAFYTYDSPADNTEKLEFWLELKDDVDMPTEDEMRSFSTKLISRLVHQNQDFRYQIEKLDANAELPLVRFFKRGQSPIGEASGHRKQVLIFNKHNLPENYTFTPESSGGVVLSKKEMVETSTMRVAA